MYLSWNANRWSSRHHYSALIQVMAWCRHATSISESVLMSPYDVTIGQNYLIIVDITIYPATSSSMCPYHLTLANFLEPLRISANFSDYTRLSFVNKFWYVVSNAIALCFFVFVSTWHNIALALNHAHARQRFGNTLNEIRRWIVVTFQMIFWSLYSN